jgi:hypothetical protein
MSVWLHGVTHTRFLVRPTAQSLLMPVSTPGKLPVTTGKREVLVGLGAQKFRVDLAEPDRGVAHVGRLGGRKGPLRVEWHCLSRREMIYFTA